MMLRFQGTVVATVCAMALVGCGEKAQTAGNTRKSDTPAWQSADNGFAAKGWKSGDEVAWQKQLQQRAQSQNEYVRIGAQKPGP